MKNITMSIVALLAMNTMAFAGGDIAPVEPEITVPEVAESTGSFYVGAGYSYMNADVDGLADNDSDAVLLLAGYNFNQYFALEARYAGITDNLENYGIYAKPMYPFGAATVYGLIGYGETSDDSDSESGFQWGLGANYAVTEQIGVFADYTNVYDDDFAGVDVTVDAINVGMTYKF
jgi:hypothetical protein